MRAMRRLFDDIRWIGLIMLLLAGSPFVLIGSTELWQTWHQFQSSRTVIGTVVDNEYLVRDDTDGAYYPVVVFTLVDGPPIRFTDKVGSLPPDYAPGATVKVMYSPSNAQEARIHSWKRVWFVPSFLLLLGSLPTLLYLGWWLMSRRRTTFRRADA